MYLSRYICDVFEEMRKANETRNYSGLAGLIEEAQSKANRMEGALGSIKEIIEVEHRWAKCKDKDRALSLLKEYKQERQDVVESLSE